jgi:hypothetical protein
VRTLNLISAPPSERDRAAIYAHYGLTCPPRFGTLRDMSRPTLGGRAARIAREIYGYGLMPHQRYVLDVLLEVNPDTGVPPYGRGGLSIMRQTGKTTITLPLFAWRGLAYRRQVMVYAAQTGIDARKKWEDDQLPVLRDCGWMPEEGGKMLPHHRCYPRKATGRESIVWRATGSTQLIQSGTERATHGRTLHMGINDEYFGQHDRRIEVAWEPAQVTVLDSLYLWLSTAGTSRSVPLNEEMAAGRERVESGTPTRSAYFEWSWPPDADRSDPRTWLAANPALCPDPGGACRCSPHWRHTITLDALRDRLDRADTREKLADFDRSYGNVPREDDDPSLDPNMPGVGEWDDLGDPDLEGCGGEALACAIDVTPSGDHAAIVAVGERGDEGADPDAPLVAVLEHGPGMEWVAARARAINAELRPVAWALDAQSRARELLGSLERAGIAPPAGREHQRGDLWLPTAAELGASCASLVGRVRRRDDGRKRLYHLRQHVLREAVAGARTRPIGDGLFAFARRQSAVDICAWVAAALGLGAFEAYRGLVVDAAEYDPMDSVA